MVDKMQSLEFDVVTTTLSWHGELAGSSQSVERTI